MDRRRVLVAAAGAALAASLAVVGGLAASQAHPSTTSAAATTTATASALQQLAAIPVKGRAPMTGYSRDQFGAAWTDDNGARGGHNQCDTRDDVLGAQLTEVRKSGRCIVIAGNLADPYTGRSIAFAYGVCKAGQRSGCSAAVQIDHIVPLGDAWQTGAQQLSMAKRVTLANDPDNLQATDGPTNAAKGDGDYATWKPPNRAFWCTYASRQVLIKREYGLWVTQPEHDALADTLKNCP